MTKPKQVTVFAGPSWRRRALPDHVRLRPPAVLGDLRFEKLGAGSVVVLVDGFFLHCAAPTHPELLALLERGCVVLGAASMGALRAAELAPCGMRGVGTVFESIRRGLLRDDAEVAVATCPETLRALSIPLVNVRLLIGLARTEGAPPASLSLALDLAQGIYFLERTPQRLLAVWRRFCPEMASFLAKTEQARFDVKAADADAAVRLALVLASGAEAPPDPAPPVPVEELFWRE
jgi:hypothetical protein